eukprot:11546688-Ditylum_brightwellii.AAC.1
MLHGQELVIWETHQDPASSYKVLEDNNFQEWRQWIVTKEVEILIHTSRGSTKICIVFMANDA